MITGAHTYTPDDNYYYYHTCRSIYSSLTRNIVVADSSFSSSNRISSLEHVVVTMTLGIVTGGTRYDYDDLYNSYGDIYEWLENPHPRRGDIKIELTSPSGTKSILLPYRHYDFVNEEGYDSWPFMSVHFWGENPSGTWRLKITYKSGSGYVRMTGVRMTLYGTATTPTSVSNIPSVCHSSCAQRCFGEGSTHCDSCRHYRIASTLECVNECPINTRAYKTYCFDDENPTTQTPSTPTPDPTTDETPSTSGSTNDIPSPSSRDNSTADDSGRDTLNLGIVIGATAGVLAIVVLAVIIGIVAYIVYMRNRKVRRDGFVRFDITQNEVDT